MPLIIRYILSQKIETAKETLQPRFFLCAQFKIPFQFSEISFEIRL
jgi:hypothetical protein